jgi:chromosome segregation ATPase
MSYTESWRRVHNFVEEYSSVLELRDALEEAKNLEEDIGNIRTTQENMKKTLADLVEEITKADGELQKKRAEFNSIGDEIAEEKKFRYDNLLKEVAEARGKAFAQIEKERDALLAEKNKLTSEVKSLDSRYRNIADGIHDAELELQRVNGVLEEARSRVLGKGVK